MSDQQKSTETNRPVETVRDGAVKGTIWRNQGENGDFYNATFSKSYRDKNGDLRDTQNFSADDILKLNVVTQRTYDRIGDLRREAFRQQRQSQGNSQTQQYSRANQSRNKWRLIVPVS